MLLKGGKKEISKMLIFLVTAGALHCEEQEKKQTNKLALHSLHIVGTQFVVSRILE